MSVCPHSKGFLAPGCQGKGQEELWDPERVSPDSGKTLTLTGQAWTPGSFPGTPIPLPYGFYLLLSSLGLDFQGKSKRIGPSLPPPPQESWLDQRVTTLPIGIACPLESYSPVASWEKGQSGGGGVHPAEEVEVGTLPS